jgi:hypothetical protein
LKYTDRGEDVRRSVESLRRDLIEHGHIDTRLRVSLSFVLAVSAVAVAVVFLIARLA